ncbi:MAG: SAM-dependent methyltransferase [Clostridiales bacterium]|nr:SAM-dependent methyltransferase [Clostridiales bacterium]
MKNECLICKAPLEYMQADTMMECAICHRRESSKTRCIHGHYVCSECHTRGMDQIFSVCMSEKGKNPFAILEKMMRLPFCHMHGPEHHVMVGAALLTAFRNAGGSIDLQAALAEMYSRGKAVPGGACGFWGACGAGISAGMYMSIVTKSTPLATQAWGLSNQMTSRALGKIGEVGGPRCCKRDSYLAMLAAVDFTLETLGIEMETQMVRCTRSDMNGQCIQARCPFYPQEQ